MIEMTEKQEGYTNIQAENTRARRVWKDRSIQKQKGAVLNMRSTTYKVDRCMKGQDSRAQQYIKMGRTTRAVLPAEEALAAFAAVNAVAAGSGSW